MKLGGEYARLFEVQSKYYQEGGNEHDDAPDCTTGIVERFGLFTSAEITDEEEEEIEDEVY